MIFGYLILLFERIIRAILYDQRFRAFRPGTYHLFKYNCNTFTEEVSNFLVGKGIPKYILDLPEEILQT